MIKGFCCDCKRERRMILVHTIYNRKHNEKKVRGMCEGCREPICRIVPIDYK